MVSENFFCINLILFLNKNVSDYIFKVFFFKYHLSPWLTVWLPKLEMVTSKCVIWLNTSQNCAYKDLRSSRNEEKENGKKYMQALS